MKKVLMLVMLSIAGQAQAKNLDCWLSTDPTHKVVVQMSFNHDGSANFVGDGLTAIGSYKESDAACPTRLCGQWSINAMFNKVIYKSADSYVDHIGVWIHNDSTTLVPEASIGVYDFNGRAPMNIELTCSEK